MLGPIGVGFESWEAPPAGEIGGAVHSSDVLLQARYAWAEFGAYFAGARVDVFAA